MGSRPGLNPRREHGRRQPFDGPRSTDRRRPSPAFSLATANALDGYRGEQTRSAAPPRRRRSMLLTALSRPCPHEARAGGPRRVAQDPATGRLTYAAYARFGRPAEKLGAEVPFGTGRGQFGVVVRSRDSVRLRAHSREPATALARDRARAVPPNPRAVLAIASTVGRQGPSRCPYVRRSRARRAGMLGRAWRRPVRGRSVRRRVPARPVRTASRVSQGVPTTPPPANSARLFWVRPRSTTAPREWEPARRVRVSARVLCRI
jgi:hypothetical protein